VLLALVEAGLERQKAYVMVQAVAMRCWQDRTSFEEAIRADADITSLLTPERLDQAFDLNYYLRHEQTIFDRVFK
jgi:adenylosuccinate lyase